ncbi:ABC transporter permease subunit [uncultured Friedmanniella sp.]|uniref:ABC transporter permease subunit n=1 Tax=uncultured Friedmanniella sp. TaxID=335381 RepID=UPI0035CB55D3
MIPLVRAELLRLRSRRLTWIALGAVLLVVLLTQLAVYTSVRPLTDTERAQAQANYAEAKVDYEQNKDQYAKDTEDCVAQGNPREACEYPEPQLEDYAQRSVSDFADVASLSVTVSVFVTGLALLFLSASLIGAEFSSGSLANWLSFVPERTKVYASKLVALVLVGAVITAVVAALAIGLTALLTQVAGAEVVGLGKIDAMGARGVLIGVIAVVIGFSLAMLTRHTIAAAGAVLGYLLLSFVLQIVMGVLPTLQAAKRLLPENNALAVLQHDYHYVDYLNEIGPDGQYNYTEFPHVITFGAGSLYWAVVLVVLLAASYVVFRRRDVS